MKTYIFGAGGLVGKQLLSEVHNSHQLPVAIPWEERDTVIEMIREWLKSLDRHETFRIIWAAGVGTVGATVDSLENETSLFKEFLGLLKLQKGTIRSVLLISSAGGIYAGCDDERINEDSTVRPISEYGTAKLAQENSLEVASKELGFTSLVARLSNVYGPNQNLLKRQGLISSLVASTYKREPLPIYVSIDTRRDYIHVKDVAQVVNRFQDLSESLPVGNYMKIICSGSTHTIAEIIGQIKLVSKRKPPIIFSTSINSSFQPMQLAFESIRHTELDLIAKTLLPVGIAELCLKASKGQHLS